ncbi:glycosyltransferase [Microbacterium foliorum]|uniref:Glycosyltransferase n=1 Tax=Microbacterium foliorum TaxID=104336 RepID=A0A4Y5YLN7_9MICO|nr:glycosyltransferase [Microbacterium foliorum]QDE33722.1 glycosyltransferase [Microbacterium foliorum]
MTSLLGSISLVLTVMFLAYMTFILIPYVRHRKEQPGDPALFEWHIFVPCRDEAAVIATTIARQRERFPAAHLWVIDDDSDDDTSAIIQAHADLDPFVHLVQRRRPLARTGKGDALNTAYDHLCRWLPADADRDRVIVAVVDADGEMAANALAAVASDDCFGDPVVGAAQITVWMKNRDDRTPYPEKGRMANAFARYLIRMQDVEFRTVILAMQSLRSKTGTVGLGGNGQFTRLSVLDRIGEGYGAPWHGALLEDYELGLHVILAGYENRQVHDTYVAQEALPSLRRLLAQRTRWSQGNIQCVKYISDIVRSRHFDSSGVLECLYYLFLPFLQIIGLIVIVLTLVFQGAAIASDPAALEGLVDHAWAFVLLGLLFGIGPFAIWGVLYKLRCEPGATWLQAVGWGAGLFFFVQYILISVTRAMLRVALRRNGWAKTRRNAETHVVGPVAVDV